MADELAAAYRRFCADEFLRVGYDLSLFDPAAHLATIMDFYDQVIDSRQRGPIKHRCQIAAVT